MLHDGFGQALAHDFKVQKGGSHVDLLRSKTVTVVESFKPFLPLNQRSPIGWIPVVISLQLKWIVLIIVRHFHVALDGAAIVCVFGCCVTAFDGFALSERSLPLRFQPRIVQ
jgi:hypothetical protein